MPIQNLSTNFLGKIVTVKMDRPLGTKHPKHGFVYPVNYGFIPNTVSGDGEELDAYVLGPTVPLDAFTGYVCAIIHRTDFGALHFRNLLVVEPMVLVSPPIAKNKKRTQIGAMN